MTSYSGSFAAVMLASAVLMLIAGLAGMLLLQRNHAKAEALPPPPTLHPAAG
jgi:hypothetical protein